jgi:hypothetical protein
MPIVKVGCSGDRGLGKAEGQNLKAETRNPNSRPVGQRLVACRKGGQRLGRESPESFSADCLTLKIKKPNQTTSSAF